jgi:DNA-binding CsgD family transcriptional regulator
MIFWSSVMSANTQQIEDSQADTPIRLTPREQQVLLWCAYGKSSWEIGRILQCQESTVNFHVGNILRKFDVSTRVAAVIKAIRYGMLAEQ